ncbi:hypothetical protein ACTHT2_22710, partial [Neisseria sp. P0017.S006]|uniref:hypothetical protein n=1 Tax=Neisseria sp. P0017.S006 TaxID=3436782 RepID=UPI003F7FE7F2
WKIWEIQEGRADRQSDKNQIFTILPLLSDGLAHREKQGWTIIPIPLFFIHNRRKILSTNSINA